MKARGGLLLTFDFTGGKEKTKLLVGRQAPGGALETLNLIQGEEAFELLKKLTGKKNL